MIAPGDGKLEDVAGFLRVNVVTDDSADHTCTVLVHVEHRPRVARRVIVKHLFVVRGASKVQCR